MGNAQGNPNESRSVAKAKRSIRVKARVLSRLVSPSGRRGSRRDSVSTHGDEVDTDGYTHVLFTQCANVDRTNQSLELDIRGGTDENDDIKAIHLLDVSQLSERSAESALTAFLVGMETNWMSLTKFILFLITHGDII